MFRLLVAAIGGAVLCLACMAPAQQAPISGYRPIDPHRIEIRTSTSEGWDTWIASVDETATTVVVSVQTRPPREAGAFPAREIWLPITLTQALGTRAVIDARSGLGVELVD